MGASIGRRAFGTPRSYQLVGPGARTDHGPATGPGNRSDGVGAQAAEGALGVLVGQAGPLGGAKRESDRGAAASDGPADPGAGSGESWGSGAVVLELS